MADWSTYRLEDFLLFSERVYWRLFELHNAALWPAQLPALVLGGVMILLALRARPAGGRMMALILAVGWLVVGGAFFRITYASINWAAPPVGLVWYGEALALALIGGVLGRLPLAPRGIGGVLALALVVYAVALHPLVAVVAGRPLATAEVFAVAPDPTAIATLGALALMRRGWLTVALMLVPLAWCAVSWATLYAMERPEAWIPLAAIPLALCASFWPRGAAPRASA